jgi:hypothetical protein
LGGKFTKAVVVDGRPAKNARNPGVANGGNNDVISIYTAKAEIAPLERQKQDCNEH